MQWPLHEAVECLSASLFGAGLLWLVIGCLLW